MDEKHLLDAISLETLEETLNDYPPIVAEKLHGLDVQRYQNIPTIIAGRKEPYLTLEELTTLVDWKLSHGTFRPALKKLVASNSDQDVREITKAGFAECANSKDKKASMSKLTELRGVGPATASLLLSTFDPVTVPFFSDELYRWSLWQDGPKAGWDRPIKYTPKEYFELCSRVETLRDRLKNVAAVDIEKVAYVLGRRTASKPRRSGPGTGSQHKVAKGLGPKAGKRKTSGEEQAPSDKASPLDGLGDGQIKATRSSKRLKSK